MRSLSSTNRLPDTILAAACGLPSSESMQSVRTRPRGSRWKLYPQEPQERGTWKHTAQSGLEPGMAASQTDLHRVLGPPDIQQVLHKCLDKRRNHDLQAGCSGEPHTRWDQIKGELSWPVGPLFTSPPPPISSPWTLPAEFHFCTCSAGGHLGARQAR